MRILVTLYHGGDQAIRAMIRGEDCEEPERISQCIVGTFGEAHRMTTTWLKQLHVGATYQLIEWNGLTDETRRMRNRS